MRVGLTGGTGFVGQYLLRDYGEEFDFVVPVREEKSVKVKARYVKSDFSVESLSEIFQNVDVVVHLAALGMPKNQNPLKLSDYTSNITLTANVFEACKNIGVKRVIYTSSKAVFINSKDTELTEKTALKPADEYGISKVCSEKIANFYSDVYDIKILCFRMGEVCGLDLNKGMVNPFWKAVLNACDQKNPVSVYGKGEAKRDLIYVKDVVRALVLGLNNNNTGDFNISYGIYTNREIAEAFCKVFDNPEGLKFYPDKPEWGTNQRLIADKAANVLDFRAEYDLMNIVSDIHKEYRNER